ncbi:MAG: hypothetical protein U9O96_07080 [Candidatus Thermoplasmatota archaeon]|nr:hypothetical protein [Candidatus Thermoplasmatota archaeon]
MKMLIMLVLIKDSEKMVEIRQKISDWNDIRTEFGYKELYDIPPAKNRRKKR